MIDLENSAPRRPLDLDAVENEILGSAFKGLDQRAVGQPLKRIGQLGLSVLSGSLPYPVAVLKDSALTHNIAWMRDFTTRAGVSLCPHGKTTMAPQLFERQLAAGCWGITAATASHVRTYRKFGVPRILLANQLIGRANIDVVLDELEGDPSFDFYALIDSHAGLALLRSALAARPIGRPLQLLLEVGARGGRSGVRTVAEGIELGRAVRDAGPELALCGVEAFEGIYGGDACSAESAVLAMLENVTQLSLLGFQEDWFSTSEVILSAGGSAFFDIVARILQQTATQRRIRVLLRSGCYVSHDALIYEQLQTRIQARSPDLYGSGVGLQNALEVWALVQSVPEPGRAICGLGKRDVSHDMTLPQPIAWYRPGVHAGPQTVPSFIKVSGLNDQHAYVDSETQPVPWQVGDLVAFGIGHPCTTFDKWPLLHLVDDEYNVIGGIRTFF